MRDTCTDCTGRRRGQRPIREWHTPSVLRLADRQVPGCCGCRWGGNAVFKRPKARVRKSTNPMVLFDYRCYAKDGRIGKDFDPTLRQCLAKLSKITAEQVQKEYGFPDLGQAEVLQQRASGEWGATFCGCGAQFGLDLTATSQWSLGPTVLAPCACGCG